jgi:hypothetical protein
VAWRDPVHVSSDALPNEAICREKMTRLALSRCVQTWGGRLYLPTWISALPRSLSSSGLGLTSFDVA